MIRNLVCAMVFVAASGGIASAQQSASANAGKLAFFVGSWSGRGEMRDGPTSAFKRITGAETCRWAAGRAAVLCEEKETGPGGGWNGIYLLGYDAKRDTYTLYGIENPGTIVRGTGKLENGEWTWTAESVADGVTSPAKYRFRAEDGSRVRTMVVEVPDASGKWFTVLNHRYTRTTR